MKESVRGLADGCRVSTRRDGGNVVPYNQSPAGPIDPTPTVAVVGLIEKPEHHDAVVQGRRRCRDPPGRAEAAAIACMDWAGAPISKSHGRKTGRRRPAIWSRLRRCT
jgi:hypothetical protein